MADMSGTDFYAYVLKVLKRTDKSAEVYEAATDTIKDMTKRHPFREMKVEAYTTAGITTSTDYRLELPQDFEHLVSDVRLINGDESKLLVKLEKEQFDEKYPYLSDPDREPGIPKHYCLWNNQILIGPIPDLTTYGYEISYCRKITSAITSDTTAVTLTDNHREAVRSGTLARVFEGLEDYEKAGYWHARHDRDLSIIMGLDTTNENAPAFQEYNGV
jgi:hypothetical protein